MGGLAIAMDLGTSGFRAQALDLRAGNVLSTVISTRHPLPGANVIDHLHFALELGVDCARDLMVEAINQVCEQLRIATDDVERLAVCGNPTQLSLFQGMEIRDLAFAGSRKLEALGAAAPDRSSATRRAGDFPGLALPHTCQVIIPPAVCDEIGADALALITQSGMLLENDETTLAIDYGTNAEMALAHQGRIFTASAAAGPALEGQHLACGALAQPGTICDLIPVGTRHRLQILDSSMQPQAGDLIDMEQITGAAATPAYAITGTGVIAALDQALGAGIISLPRICTADRKLHFGKDLWLSEDDLAQAGKAIGALRAGYFTLSVEAGIAPDDIRTAYLAGASGSCMDAHKASRLGLIPPHVRSIRQVGNTSLALARELALAPARLAELDALAASLRPTHRLFAQSRTFASLFLLELSYWTEGMPMATYREMLRRYRLPDLLPARPAAKVTRAAIRDMGELGAMGLNTLEHIGRVVGLPVAGCTACMSCIELCPGHALSIGRQALPSRPAAPSTPATIRLDFSRCMGVACRRCEPDCPVRVFDLGAFFALARHRASADDAMEGD